MKRSTGALLIALCGLYLGIRMAWLSQAFDHLVFPNYELYPPGVLGRIFQLGLDQPLGIQYDNSGGAWINALLAAPLYEVFGPSYLVYKCVPLLMGLVLLLVCFFWVRGMAGEKPALACAFLFAMGPTELLQKYSLIGTGNHFENLLYMGLVLWAFDAAHRKGCTPRSLFLVGLAAGINLFVILAAVIPVGCIAALHILVRGVRGTVRDMRFLGPGLALGLLPLAWMNLVVSPRGLQFLLSKFGAESGAQQGPGFLSRCWTFVSTDMQQAPFHGDSHPWLGWALLGLWVVCASFLGVRLLRRLSRTLVGLWGARSEDESRTTYEGLKYLPLVLWTPLAAVAFGLSNLANGKHAFPVEVGGYRYYLPHFFVLSVMVSVWAVGRVAGRAPRFRAFAGWAVIAGMGLLGLQPLGELARAGDHPGVGSHYEGFSFVQYARAFVLPSSGVSRVEALDWANQLPELESRRMHRGLGFYHAQLALAGDANGDGEVDGEERAALKTRPNDALPFSLDVLLAQVPRTYHVDWLRGAGSGIRTLTSYQRNEVTAIQKVILAMAKGGDPRVVHLLEGVCWKQAYDPLAWRVPHLADRAVKVAASLAVPGEGAAAMDDLLVPAAGRALGIFLGRLLARDYGPEQGLLGNVFEVGIAAHGSALLEGMGIGLADNRAQLIWPLEGIDRMLGPDQRVQVARAWLAECKRMGGSRLPLARELLPQSVLEGLGL